MEREAILALIHETRAHLARIEALVVGEAPVEEPVEEPEVVYPTNQEVADAVINFINLGGDRQVVVEALAHFGTQRAGGLAEENRADFIDMIQNAEVE